MLRKKLCSGLSLTARPAHHSSAVHSVLQAVLRSWAIPPAATFSLGLAAVVYVRGWWLLWQSGVPYVPPWRAGSFLLGLLSIWIALASPLDTFAPFVLTAHMLQHMLLMMIAPPLLLLGAPLIPLVRGLPIFAAREFAGPLLNWPLAQRVGRAIIHPVFALLLMGAVMLGWHVPAPYELALGSSSWHEFEHACFLIGSLIFWWPVVQPWPSIARWPRWSMVPYLLIGDLQNTLLSAILVFSDRPLYPTYATVPRLFALSAVQDQAAAGAIMWVVGSVAFLVPAVVIAIQCLSRKPSAFSAARLRTREEAHAEEEVWARPAFLLRLLPARTSERGVQAVSFVLLFVLWALCFSWLLSSSAADDDDQVLHSVESSGSFLVTLLAPQELIAGTNSFSVLVQDAKSHDVLLDARVDLLASPVTGQTPASHVRASYDDSQNKLLQSAELNLPATRDWKLEIAVRRGSEQTEFSLPLELTTTESASHIPRTHLLIVGFAALLLIVYLHRHRKAKPARLDPSISSA